MALAAALAQYRCYTYHNTGQTVTAGNTTALNQNSEIFDSVPMHDTVTNNQRHTIAATGLYRIHGRSEVSGNDAGTAVLHLRVNGSSLTPEIKHSFVTSATNWEDQTLQVSGEFFMSAGAYVELYGQSITNDFTFTSTQLTVIGLGSVV